MNQFFYRLEGLCVRDMPMSGAGFTVHLDRVFARKAYETKLSKGVSARLEEFGKHLIMKCFELDEDPNIQNFSFLRNEKEEETLLLQYVATLGNASDLGLEGNDLYRIIKSFNDPSYDKLPIEYGPHNIDIYTQAYTLASMWTSWAELARLEIK